MPLVIVALAGQGASVRELQVALRPLQRLDRRLLIDTENDRLGRRVELETDHVGRFRRELRVIALAPGLAGSQIDVVFAQKAPNILNVNILQRHRQPRTRPAGVARRRRLIQKRQNASVRRLTVDWLLVCPRAISNDGLSDFIAATCCASMVMLISLPTTLWKRIKSPLCTDKLGTRSACLFISSRCPPLCSLSSNSRHGLGA